MIRMLQIHRFKTLRSGMIGDGQPFRACTVFVGDSAAGAALMEILYLSAMSRRACSVIVPAVNPPVHEATMITAETTDLLGLRPMERLRQRAGVTQWMFEHGRVSLDTAGCLEIGLDLPRGHPLRSIRLADDQPLIEDDIPHAGMFSLTDLDGIPGDLIPPGLLWTGYPVERRHYLWDRRWVYANHPAHPLDTIAAWVEAGDGQSTHVLWCDMHTATGMLPEPGMQAYPAQPPHDPEAQRMANVLVPLRRLAERADQGEPGLFLWEFPECGMHPTNLERMLHDVVQIVNNRPIQMFVFTHSIEVLAHWARMVDRHILPANDTIAYRLLIDNDELNSLPFQPASLHGWLEFGLDPRMHPKDTTNPVLYWMPWDESSNKA